jgi:methyl-accepting chemotaxis protein
MKIKYKLSVLMIAIVVAVTGSVAILLLRQASNISKDLNIKGIELVTDQQVSFWEGRYNGYFQVLRSVAAIMENYESVQPENRRDDYDNMLFSTLQAQTNFVRIFTVWKPNALDNMDSRYIGRPGSTATGQYVLTYGRDTGTIQVYTNLVLDQLMDRLNSDNEKEEWINDPSTFNLNG